MTYAKRTLLKTILVAAVASTAFTVGFCYGVKAEEVLGGQLPARQAENFSPVIRHHRPLIDSSGNRVGHFICGLTQRRYFGLPPKFNLALNWATLPHVAPQPGAVVVQTRKGHALGGGRGGHVSRIVELTSDPRFAIVTDEKGTYRRDIKKNLVAYVRPN